MKLICPSCGSAVSLVSSSQLTGQPGWMYLCNQFPDCDARVRCHPGTIISMGTMAEAELRRWRARAHLHFDLLWSTGQLSRSQAYRWLAEEMNLPSSKTHFGKFNQQQCKQAIELIKKRQQRFYSLRK